MGLWRSILATVFVCFLGIWTFPANAMSFEVTNLQVTAQSTDAVKARELALAQAQRKALSVLVGRAEPELATITDAQIARLVRGFSVRGERLAARAYTANFTIRFNPNATISFVQSNGYDFAHADKTGPIDANPTGIVQSPSATQPVTDTATQAPQDAAATAMERTVVVLPILDIGTQNVLWSDPNPWREIWQAKDYSEKGLNVRVPLGDIADVNDVPDVNFLNGAQYNFASLIERYSASTAYITIVKNQGSGGVLLSLYRHDGKKLSFIRKMIVNPRPGFRFDDTVPAAMQMIVMAHNNASDAADSVNDVATNTLPTAGLSNNAAAPAQNIGQGNQPMIVTIPYQSLQQWVAIQNRLRLVAGITSVVPMRVSPSSAKARLTTNVGNTADLQRNLSLQRFDLQYLPTGEIVLIELSQ